MGRLDDEQPADIRELLERGLSSAEIARRLRIPTMRVAAVRAHMTMGTHEQPSRHVRTGGSAARRRDRAAPREAEFVGPAHGADALARGPAVSVGIDVAEAKRGLDLVGLDRERNIVASRGRLTVDDVVALTIALQPVVVCIDSPSGWSTSGRSRQSERELAAVGIQSYRTGPDPGNHRFYVWMRVGFSIFDGLSASYPLYCGGKIAGTAAEVFPHATACLLAGELRPAETSKQVFRRAVLRDAGVTEHELQTLDQVDAALGALTGLIALEHRHSTVGDPQEGVILLPVPQLPHGPLPRRSCPSTIVSSRSGSLKKRTDLHDPGRTDDLRGGYVAAASRLSTRDGAPETLRRHRRSLDFQMASRFIAAVPCGRWTSYKDVATAAGNERGAQAVGEWLRRRGHELTHVYRVIRSNGLVADGFRAAGPGIPPDAPTARDLLRAEGVRFDLTGRASPMQRFRPSDWDLAGPAIESVRHHDFKRRPRPSLLRMESSTEQPSSAR